VTDNQKDLAIQFANKGLTENEAKVLAKWVDAGKPGLHKSRAGNLGHLYTLGYTCDEIHKWNPQYPIELLLWARIEYDWDGVKERYQRIMHGRALESALSAKQESVRLLADIIAATNLKWRRDLMEYLSDPDNKKFPEFVPTSLRGYREMLEMLDGLISVRSSDDKSLPSPLVNINFGNSKADPKEISSELAMRLEEKRGLGR
jgi:hypothetical protein